MNINDIKEVLQHVQSIAFVWMAMHYGVKPVLELLIHLTLRRNR